MKKFKGKIGILFLAFLIMAPPAPVAWAQAYDISWWTVNGGGGTGVGGNYTLSGTIGQPDVGMLAGGGYTLVGGFWSLEIPQMIFLPLILKN